MLLDLLKQELHLKLLKFKIDFLRVKNIRIAILQKLLAAESISNCNCV